MINDYETPEYQEISDEEIEAYNVRQAKRYFECQVCAHVMRIALNDSLEPTEFYSPIRCNCCGSGRLEVKKS